MKKIFIPVILCVLFFAGCATQNTMTGNAAAAPERWRDIKASDNVYGKWEGYNVSYIPKNAEAYMPESSLEVGISFEYLRDAIEVICTMKIDMNKFITDWQSLPEIKETGLSKDDLWELLSDEFAGLEGFTIGGKYFVNYDLSDESDSFFDGDSAGKFQINENGDKIKMIFFDSLSFGLGDEGFNEIILSRR